MKNFEFIDLIVLLSSVELILVTGLLVTNKNTPTSLLGTGNMPMYI